MTVVWQIWRVCQEMRCVLCGWIDKSKNSCMIAIYFNKLQGELDYVLVDLDSHRCWRRRRNLHPHQEVRGTIAPGLAGSGECPRRSYPWKQLGPLQGASSLSATHYDILPRWSICSAEAFQFQYLQPYFIRQTMIRSSCMMKVGKWGRISSNAE